MFNFFKKSAMGIDISDFSIEVLELGKKFNKVYLKAFGREDLERGTVSQGKILNKEKLREKIRKVLNGTLPKKIKTKRAIISLPESKTFFRIFKIEANLKEKELKEAVLSQAEKFIPLEKEKMAWDFQILENSGIKKELKVLYVAAPKEIINDYLGIFKEEGIEVIALENEAVSLGRAFEKEMADKGSVLIADIGAKNSNFIVFDKGLVRFSTILPLAGEDWTRDLAEELKVPVSRAEELKINYGLDPKKMKGKIMLILQKVLQEAIKEIRKTINFYEASGESKIKKILLAGGSALLPELPEYLTANLGIKTKIADPWEGIEVEKLFEKRNRIPKVVKTKLHPIYFATVMGLAKRGLLKNPEKAGINLLSNYY